MKMNPKTLLRAAVVCTAIGCFAALNGVNLSEVLIRDAEARLGRPATPVSYAGVARRSTVRVATPGVGARPGVGAGQAGVGYSRGAGGNLGGPVNRVGVR